MLILSCITSSYAAEGKWSDGFGQGDYEYSIEVKKYRLYISCPTENGNASASSYVEFSNGGKELKSFEISVGGRKYQGPFEASSRVGANNFTALLDDLKKSDAVVTFKDGSVTLPKSNAASVLPSYGKKGFACNLDDVQSPTESAKPNKPAPALSKPSVASVQSSTSSSAQVTRLECNTNVNCNDKNDVVNKLRSLWIKFDSPSEPAKSYAGICFDVIKNVQSFPAGMALGPNLISPQLNHCNDAVAQIQRLKK